MRHALAAAARRGHRAVLLVGDAAYYGRFGFSAERTDGCGCRASPTRRACSAANSSPARSTRARRDPGTETPGAGTARGMAAALARPLKPKAA